MLRDRKIRSCFNLYCGKPGRTANSSITPGKSCLPCSANNTAALFAIRKNSLNHDLILYLEKSLIVHTEESCCPAIWDGGVTMNDTIVKVLLAIGVGILVGLEREYHEKAAGLRVIPLVCVGATLFTLYGGVSGNKF